MKVVGSSVHGWVSSYNPSMLGQERGEKDRERMRVRDTERGETDRQRMRVIDRERERGEKDREKIRVRDR